MPTQTVQAIHWWDGGAAILIGAVVGGVIGSVVPWLLGRRARSVERRGEIEGMLIEMHLAQIYMNALERDAVMAPLYRLPLTVFKQTLPKLMGERLLDINRVGALVEYVNRAEELNRGLDRAGDAHASAALTLASEYNRNVAKAREIAFEPLQRLGDETLLRAVMSALLDLEDAERDRWWSQLFLQEEE